MQSFSIDFKLAYNRNTTDDVDNDDDDEWLLGDVWSDAKNPLVVFFLLLLLKRK